MANNLEELIILKRTALRYLFARESRLLALGKKPVNKKIANIIKNHQENNVWSNFWDSLNEDLTRNIYVYEWKVVEDRQSVARRYRLDSTSKDILLHYDMGFWGGKMAEAPVVTVEHGQLQGRVVGSPGGKSFFSFQGIPYAKPPLGSLRFQAPQPLEPWDGIRDATTEGNISAQMAMETDSYEGDENCLYLNVYTPNLDGEFLPVMVYIHGGGLQFGSGSASTKGADYLVEKDVVVVTLNYRCGALGFLCLNTPEVPGNAGFKDMAMAIRWVKENIRSFGGNSGNITIFGESAGGAAVSVLTASPLTKDLISKAIIQSGCGLSSWVWQKQPLENAKKLAHLLGCESEDADDILEFLRATPAKEIVGATRKLFSISSFFETAVAGFTLVVEKEFPGVEAAIAESFTDLLTSGRTAEVPVMIGSTALEFLHKIENDDLQVFIPAELNVQRNSEESVEIANKFRSSYFKGNPTSVENLKGYFELISDRIINVDTHRYVQYLVQASTKPVYYYKFDYVGELNITKKLMDSLGIHQAGHTDELGYIFKNETLKDIEPTAQDIKMRERLLRLWTNFAKSGNPTPDENHFITVTWQPVTKDNLYYLNISNELSLNTNPDKDRMALWDELYNRYYKVWEHANTNTEETPVRKAVDEPVVTAEPEIIEPATTKPETIEPVTTEPEPIEPITTEPETIEPATTEPEIIEPATTEPETVKVAVQETIETVEDSIAAAPQQNGNVNGSNGDVERKSRPSNEIKMVQNGNGVAKDVIRANDPPEDDLPKNIGVNKFVNFFESLGGKK